MSTEYSVNGEIHVKPPLTYQEGKAVLKSSGLQAMSWDEIEEKSPTYAVICQEEAEDTEEGMLLKRTYSYLYFYEGMIKREDPVEIVRRFVDAVVEVLGQEKAAIRLSGDIEVVSEDIYDVSDFPVKVIKAAVEDGEVVLYQPKDIVWERRGE